jgi:tetratricopeptide (TPR) repeat protein
MSKAEEMAAMAKEKGIENFKLKNYERALEYFNKAIELDPNKARHSALKPVI